MSSSVVVCVIKPSTIINVTLIFVLVDLNWIDYSMFWPKITKQNLKKRPDQWLVTFIHSFCLISWSTFNVKELLYMWSSWIKFLSLMYPHFLLKYYKIYLSFFLLFFFPALLETPTFSNEMIINQIHFIYSLLLVNHGIQPHNELFFLLVLNFKWSVSTKTYFFLEFFNYSFE